MKRILVISPHADDETLGCGGTLLRHSDSGDELYWVLVTEMSEAYGYKKKDVVERRHQISSIVEEYPFKEFFQLTFEPAMLDSIPLKVIVSKISEIIEKIQPQYCYIPFGGDVHSDHKIVHEASCSCLKWFRHPSIEKVMAYEVLSETEFGVNLASPTFKPNVYVDISQFIEAKMELCDIYKHEFSNFPFPRSKESVLALAKFRGGAVGVNASEAFMLVKEVV